MDDKPVTTANSLKDAQKYVNRLNKGIQFHDFANIPVPKFLNSPEWLDESWGNDVTAHVRLDLQDSPYELWVWVHPENVTDRESPEYKRYVVIVYNHDNGDELHSADCETDEECEKHIKLFRSIIERKNRYENN